MPTKPDPIADLPPVWGGAGNYSVGTYPILLPWGDSNPLAGQPLPWGGQPRLNTTGLTSFANSGFTPQIPNDASSMNEYDRRMNVWTKDWVVLGTNAPDADAHIMETTILGLSRAVAYQAEVGITGAGAAAPVILIMGASVPAGETVTFDDASTLALAGSSVISGPAASSVTTGTVDTIGEAGTVKPGTCAFYTQSGALPTTDGELAWGGRNILTVGGSGGAARRISIPVEEYLAGPVATMAAIEDTGLAITLTLAEDDVVYAELDLEAENSGGNNDIAITITVDGSPVGGTRTYRPSAADRVQAVRRVIKFEAPSTASYEFKGRHGASAGTTTSTNLRLLIRQANDFA